MHLSCAAAAAAAAALMAHEYFTAAAAAGRRCNYRTGSGPPREPPERLWAEYSGERATDEEAAGRDFARYVDYAAEAWATAVVAAGVVPLRDGSCVPLRDAMAARAEWKRETWCAEIDNVRGGWFGWTMARRPPPPPPLPTRACRGRAVVRVQCTLQRSSARPVHS
jgi:hypothetical protein